MHDAPFNHPSPVILLLQSIGVSLQVTALSAQNVELKGALAEADAARTLLAAQVAMQKPGPATFQMPGSGGALKSTAPHTTGTSTCMLHTGWWLHQNSSAPR
jgi:hypothetical protein